MEISEQAGSVPPLRYDVPENVVLYLLKQHQNDNEPWFPIVSDEVDYEAARRYYVQQLYEQAKQFQSPFLRKKVLAWIAEILEEPLYGLIKRYRLDGEWAKQDQIQMPAFSDFGEEPWIPQGPFLDETVNTEEDRSNRRIHRRPRSRRVVPTATTEEDLDERGVFGSETIVHLANELLDHPRRSTHE